MGGHATGACAFGSSYTSHSEQTLVRDSNLAGTLRRIPILRAYGKGFRWKWVPERILAPAVLLRRPRRVGGLGDLHGEATHRRRACSSTASSATETRIRWDSSGKLENECGSVTPVGGSDASVARRQRRWFSRSQAAFPNRCFPFCHGLLRWKMPELAWYMKHRGELSMNIVDILPAIAAPSGLQRWNSPGICRPPVEGAGHPYKHEKPSCCSADPNRTKRA